MSQLLYFIIIMQKVGTFCCQRLAAYTKAELIQSVKLILELFCFFAISRLFFLPKLKFNNAIYPHGSLYSDRHLALLNFNFGQEIAETMQKKQKSSKISFTDCILICRVIPYLMILKGVSTKYLRIF